MINDTIFWSMFVERGGMMVEHVSSHIDVNDMELIQALRNGDRSCEAELYARYQARAMYSARRILGDSPDVEDVVSESFLRVFDVIRRGGGPTEFFGAYLSKTVVHLSYEYVKTGREVSWEDESFSHLPDEKAQNGYDEQFEAAIVYKAFQNLPERWRHVLWYSEIEGMPPREIAPLMGMAPNSVAALTSRAREGLRESYIASHINECANIPPSCVKVRERLPRYVRQRLTKRVHGEVSAHLTGCAGCLQIYRELREVGGAMRGYCRHLP